MIFSLFKKVKNEQDGFILFETVLGLVILSIIIVSFLFYWGKSIEITKEEAARIQARNLALNSLIRIKGEVYKINTVNNDRIPMNDLGFSTHLNSIALEESDDSNLPTFNHSITFDREVTLQDYGGNPDCKKVTITVVFNDGEVVKLQSLFINKTKL